MSSQNNALQQLVADSKTVSLQYPAKGYPVLNIENSKAMASVALQGATVFRYQSMHAKPLLWLSSKAEFAHDKSIRGGIPICWPWFGERHPAEKEDQQNSMPKHGLLRTRPAHLLEIEETADKTSLRFGFSTVNDAAEVDFPDSMAEVTLHIASTLKVELTTTNLSDKSCEYSAALHSYLAVGDVSQVTVLGLEDTDYLDKPQNFARFTQKDAPEISGEFDRVYTPTHRSVRIKDDKLDRELLIQKSNSDSTIVWNPGPALAAELADFDGSAYQQMLCVEAGKVHSDSFELGPGERYTFSTTLSSRPLY